MELHRGSAAEAATRSAGNVGHDLRELALDIPEQICITRDNVQVGVDGVLYMQVLDAERASARSHDADATEIRLESDARAVQIGCNNGRELLSLPSLGAIPVLGIDQSAAFLDQARRLASRIFMMEGGRLRPEAA